MCIEEIAESCPFCRKNCNCNVCLRSKGMIEVYFTLMSSPKLIYVMKQKYHKLDL